MAEYIEREKAIRALCDGCVDDGYCGEKDLVGRYACDDVPKLLAIPAADVRPVVRGKWIMNDECRTVCSLCGNVVAFVSHPDRRWDFGNFCPNCGADMREADFGEN